MHIDVLINNERYLHTQVSIITGLPAEARRTQAGGDDQN